MKDILVHIVLSALLGALIGAVAGLTIADSKPEGALGGAAIGLLIGAYFGIRMQAYRAARRHPAAAVRKAQQRQAQSRTLKRLSPDSDMGDSIKVGTIHGKMDRFKDGTAPY